MVQYLISINFQRRTQPILAWLLCVIVVFFPECGLVMFMSLYYWVIINLKVWFILCCCWTLDCLTIDMQTLGTPFGMVELIFWIVRASLNVSVYTFKNHINSFRVRYPEIYHDMCDISFSWQILGAIQVFSLYSQWKEEKNVSRRLRDLSMVISMVHFGALLWHCTILFISKETKEKT